MTDPNSPQLLLAVNNEVQAGAIVSALSAAGIDANMVGELTAGFRAEAPGFVRVMVRASDLAAAKKLLTEIEQEKEEIDWPNVDVGEPLEE